MGVFVSVHVLFSMVVNCRWIFLCVSQEQWGKSDINPGRVYSSVDCFLFFFKIYDSRVFTSSMNVWSFWFIYCSNVVTLYERANVLRFYASFYYYIKWLLDFFFYFNTKGCYTGGLKTFLSFIVVWPGERGNQGVELSLVPKVNCEKLDIWSI